MTQEPKRTFGLMLKRYTNSIGDETIEARLCCREEGFDYPRGLSSEHALDGLGLRGWVSTGWKNNEPAHFVAADEPEYRDVYCIDQRRAEAMSKTLRLVNKRIQKDGARSPGEVFLAVARALKLSFVVVRPKNETARSYDEGQWNRYDIGDGKRHFEWMIADAVAEIEERRQPKAMAS